MKFALAACAALLFWTSQTQAQWFGCCVSYETRAVTTYRPEWREEKVPCMVQRVNYRKEVKQVPCTTWVPQMFEQKVRTSCYVPVPKVVTREVSRCVMVPVPYFDPCTCCYYVRYCPQWVTQQIQCTEYDYRVEPREETVRVCKMVPQSYTVEQVCWIPEVTQEPSWTVRRYCVMVPCQVMVCVPVFVPCCCQ